REATAGGAAAGIPRGELLRYALEAAKVLDYLNKPRHFADRGPPVGILHGDVKPQNILLVGDGVKVGDFGLVQLLGKGLTARDGAAEPPSEPGPPAGPRRAEAPAAPTAPDARPGSRPGPTDLMPTAVDPGRIPRPQGRRKGSPAPPAGKPGGSTRQVPPRRAGWRWLIWVPVVVVGVAAGLAVMRLTLHDVVPRETKPPDYADATPAPPV